MEDEMTPTVVVGVVKTGVNVVDSHSESNGLGWREIYAQYFKYVVIDSDGAELYGVVSEIHPINVNSQLDISVDEFQIYLYLPKETEIVQKGTNRQRVVGRYLLEQESAWNKTRDTILLRSESL